MIIELTEDLSWRDGVKAKKGSHLKAEWSVPRACFILIAKGYEGLYVHESQCVMIKETPSEDTNAVEDWEKTANNSTDKHMGGILHMIDKQQNKDPNKYAYTPKTYENGTMDHYLLMESLPKQPSSPIDHAIKKLTFAGTRGVKDEVQDLEEALQSINKRINYLTRARDGEWAK